MSTPDEGAILSLIARDVIARGKLLSAYRSYREISETYGKYFLPMQHIEERWLESRLGTVVHPVPVQIKRLFVNKMAGMVFTCAKAA